MFKCRCCGEKKADGFCCEHDVSICLDCCEDDCEDSIEERSGMGKKDYKFKKSIEQDAC